MLIILNKMYKKRQLASTFEKGIILQEKPLA